MTSSPLLVRTWARFIRFSHSISAVLGGIRTSFLRLPSCELSCVAGAGTNAGDYFDFICPAKGEIRTTRIGMCAWILLFSYFCWLPRLGLRCGEFMRSCVVCMFFFFYFFFFVFPIPDDLVVKAE